jgi:hypothetical protein
MGKKLMSFLFYIFLVLLARGLCLGISKMAPEILDIVRVPPTTLRISLEVFIKCFFPQICELGRLLSTR